MVQQVVTVNDVLDGHVVLVSSAWTGPGLEFLRIKRGLALCTAVCFGDSVTESAALLSRRVPFAAMRRAG